ncbi:MAG: SUMF1/EgtB/PvdO family nonheme iron enzyme [Rhodopirellula sp.]|nr:SUMF1/EgtB/PvdO family nonheme iron enzyme [Rhodopirellula sp.]
MSKFDRDSTEASTGPDRRGFFAYRPASLVGNGAKMLIVLAGLMATGCGGTSTPQPTVSEKTSVRPRTDSSPVGFARRVEDKVEETVDLSGVDPNDVFDVATSPPPNFMVVGKAPVARPDDQFVAVTDPAAGSSRFEVMASSASVSADNTANRAAALPTGFAAVSDTPIVDGLPSRIICQADQSEMILIPAGDSVVGVNEGPENCVPEVQVSLSAFYISKLEVNVAQYARFRSQSIRNGKVVEKPINVDAPSDLPAVGIAWAEARAYAQATDRELPTECQWEKAARGSQGLAAPWGNGRPLWSEPREIGQINACGMFPDDRSVFGVLDLAGNAQEWMLDFYSETNHEDLAVMDAGRRRNWAGPRRTSQAGERVVKGDGPSWAAWYRRGRRMTERDPNVGFRCVLNLTATQ